MPGSSEALGSVEVSFCTGTDQPVTAVAASDTSVKTWVPSGSKAPEVIADSRAKVAPSIPKGALHLKHTRDSGGLLVWQAGHSTIESKHPCLLACIYTVTQMDRGRQTFGYYAKPGPPKSCRAWRTQQVGRMRDLNLG